MQVCEVPQGEYKLGVGRIFLKHRAAQMLDALHYFDQASLEPHVRAKVAQFWEAAGRIQLRLLTYYRQRKFRQFMHGVIVAQRCLRMWLARSRYNRVLRAARTIQHALRSRAVHLLYAAWRDRRLGAVALQSAARARAARRAYLQRRGAAMLIQRAVRRGWAPEASAWEKAATAFQDMFHKLAFFREKEQERAQSLRGAPRDGA